MTKSQKKIGHCELCKRTIIINIEDDFFCNNWDCFNINIKDKNNYDIKNLKKIMDYEK